MENINIPLTGINEKVIEQIKDIAARHGISRVVLFGSRARGDFKRASDIDLAVSGGNFPAFALDVDEETSTLLMFDFVDLGSNVQPELLTEIERDGKLIYEKI